MIDKNDPVALLKWARSCVPYPSDCHKAICDYLDGHEAAKRQPGDVAIPDTHGKPCYCCGGEICCFSGNPGKWPVAVHRACANTIKRCAEQPGDVVRFLTELASGTDEDGKRYPGYDMSWKEISRRAKAAIAAMNMGVPASEPQGKCNGLSAPATTQKENDG